MSGDHYYSDDEIAAFAAAQGCTVDDFKTRWIIASGGAYYLHGPAGYLSPIKKQDLSVAMRDVLSRVPPPDRSVAGIEWKEERANKIKVPRELDKILADHSTVAFHVRASMSIPRSYFDPASLTFYERACPLRPLEPKEDPQIDRWLRLIGGERAETLLDWVAQATYLDRPICGVYFHAPKGVGKNLFADGIARLYDEAPTALDALTGPFNSAIAECPIIFADEELPKGITSAYLRSLVGRESHPLRRKNIPEAKIKGFLRLILAANNPDLLTFTSEDFTTEDIGAVAERFLYIRSDPAAADYLREIGGYEHTAAWVRGDGIARHALWLRDTRAVKPGPRFLVKGEIETIHRRLATGGSIRGLIVEWVIRALQMQWSIATEYPGIRYGRGRVCVNAAFIKANWDRLMHDKEPTTDKIGKALGPLATERVRYTVTVPRPTSADKPQSRRRLDFHVLDVDHVYRVAEELQLATRAELEPIIGGPWNWQTGITEEDQGEAQPTAPERCPSFDGPRSFEEDQAEAQPTAPTATPERAELDALLGVNRAQGEGEARGLFGPCPTAK